MMYFQVVGWGSTSTDSDKPQYSDELLIANLNYINRTKCVGKLHHLSIDNFCGGGDKGNQTAQLPYLYWINSYPKQSLQQRKTFLLSGPGARKGDSGGGFVFKFKNRYYIRGIVSTNNKNQTSSISAFTDVSLYISWIRNYVY